MLLLQNGYVYDPKTGLEGLYDILIENKKIKKIAPSIEIPKDCQVIQAEGYVIAPGLVDVHVHFRDPGFTHKEDIFTGARAAARGGFTSVVLMANTKPAVDSKETIEEIMNKAAQTDIHVYTCATVTKGMKGQELVDMEQLYQAGAWGFTDDGVPIMDGALVEEAMKKTAELDVPISFHEENPELITNNGVNRGKASEFYGIGGSPREAEISLIKRDIKIAEKTGAAINIQHISTREGVELVRRAKAKGYHNIYAEATPHHFTLTEDAVIQYGTNAKMNPPLREEADRQAIIKGLVDGTIDVIATDHAPHSPEEKAQDITKAPSGIIGLETALSLGITTLVKGGFMTLKQLIEKMSTNPAAMYHLNAGYLAEGGPADLVVFDTKDGVKYDEFVSKSRNTPFAGWELSGQVYLTICDGKIIYEKK